MVNSPNLVNLIDNPNISADNPDDLIYTNIFPYLKVDYTIQEAGTYIGIKLEYPDINDNELYKDVILTFLIVSANGCLKVPGGYSRTDLIAEELLSLFNWSSDLGFKIKLYAEKEDPVNENFYYRRLTFESVAPNSVENGVKIN